MGKDIEKILNAILVELRIANLLKAKELDSKSSSSYWTTFVERLRVKGE